MDFSIFNDPMADVGLGFSGLGAYGQIMNAMRASQQAAQQDRLQRQMMALGKTPINPNQFYAPMSDAEQAARMRAIKADMASRGIPFDSGYATNLTAEGMAGTESQRYQAALNAAMQNRGLQMSAFQGGMPGQMNFGAGDISPIFAYLGKMNAARKGDPGLNTVPTGMGAQSPQAPFDYSLPDSGTLPDVSWPVG